MGFQEKLRSLELLCCGIDRSLSRSKPCVSPTHGDSFELGKEHGCAAAENKGIERRISINAGCFNAKPDFIFRLLFSTLII